MASALAWAPEMCAGVQLHRRPPQRSPQAGLFNLKRYRIVFTKQSLRTFSRFFFVEIPRTVQYTRGLLFQLWHSTPRDKSPECLPGKTDLLLRMEGETRIAEALFPMKLTSVKGVQPARSSLLDRMVHISLYLHKCPHGDVRASRVLKLVD